MHPNNALQPTVKPLRGLPSAELERYASQPITSHQWSR
jgi:hypothetical protein